LEETSCTLNYAPSCHVIVQFTPEEVTELNVAVAAIEIRGARLPDAVLVFTGVEAAPKKLS
jgi:hypothetical protein